MVESALPRPSPTVCDGPPLQEGEGYFLDNGFCDFAFGYAQNDRGERHTAQSESFRAGETKHKEIWCYAHWVLTLCLFLKDALHIDFDSVRNSCCDYVHWLLIDATSIDF